MDNFSDIIHFKDSDAALAVKQLLHEQDFIHAIRCLRFPNIANSLNPILYRLIKRQLNKRLKQVDSLNSFQKRMFYYLDFMARSTAANVSCSGLQHLDKETSYLFISNHRDITLDPAFINYFLYQRWGKSLRIAVGDNLFDDSFISLLMLLNKSFSVIRHEPSPKKRLSYFKQLSAFIHHCIKNEQHSVWIAQRNGRAKNGIDISDPVIIKMLAINRGKTPFADYIKSLNIVPVAISYQYDPCDTDKAQELYTLENTGVYHKSENEDINSISKGILGYKGHVHVAFGKPIDSTFIDAESLSLYLDKQIQQLYQPHSSNLVAYELINGSIPSGLSYSKKQQQEFMARLAKVPEHLKTYWLQAYANPLKNHIAP